jgi:hypothetical protein
MNSIPSKCGIDSQPDTKNNLSVNCTPPSKRERIKKTKKTDEELVALFWSSSTDALFDQETIAAVTKRSTKTIECDRWRGRGISYRKCSGRVLYKKADVISWIESHQLVTSTSEYEVPHA